MTFLWFATITAAFTVRGDLLGCFHSEAIKLDTLCSLWTRVVLGLFASPLRVNHRLFIVGDGVKLAKRGKKMLGAKLLHQVSDSNKPEYIMVHSLRSVCILTNAASSVFAVPLASHIHGGFICSNRDRGSLLDKMINLLRVTDVEQALYLVADAF